MSDNPNNNDTPPAPQPAPEKSLQEIVAEAKASASKKAAARKAKRAELDQVQPDPKEHIVAWVDLLGFRDELEKADTQEKFQKVHRRMRMVHEEFDKPTASVEADQEEMNAGMGKTIVALSDGLVIAQNLEEDGHGAAGSSRYEKIMNFLASLQLAQARCASVGNLVRGGVAVGYFWFKDDIMLSPALVDAYNMETKKAVNPVIILHRKLKVELQDLQRDEGFNDDDPLKDLFRDCKWRVEEPEPGQKPKPSTHVMLHFMHLFHENDDPLPFLKRYYKHLIEKREAAPDEAKHKYDWLIKYLREFIVSDMAHLEEEVFGQPGAAGAPPEEARPE